MDISSLVDYHVLGVPILPIMIFFARIIDVSVGTMRIIFLSRGMKFIPPLLGFFEVLIWLLAVSQVVRNVNTPILLVAYSTGYACGNYIGIVLEHRLRLGTVILRIITKRDASKVISLLRSKSYGVTIVEAEGAHGRVHIIFMVLKRKDLPNVITTVESLHPHAFFSVEDVREVRQGIFPPQKSRGVINPLQRK